MTLGLMMLSCCLLRMAWDQVLFFGAVIMVMTFALNGLATAWACCIRTSRKPTRTKSSADLAARLFRAEFFYILASVLLLVFGAAVARARQLGGGRHHGLRAAVVASAGCR